MNKNLFSQPWMRHFMLVAAATIMAACGGGGGSSPPPPAAGPAISRFETGAPVFVGDTAQLTAVFNGGTGRIEPGVGTVQSGVPVRTGRLDRDQTFRLIVEAHNGAPATRELSVAVRFRNQYSTLPRDFVASQHAAVATGDGGVLLIGGSRGTGVLADAIDRVDPATGTIERLGSLAAGRAQAKALRLADGRVLVAGGSVSSGDPRAAELIDERTGAVQAAGQLSVVRVDHTMTPLPGGRVLVTGGYVAGEGAAVGVSRSAEVWEPGSGSFRRLAQTMRIGRAAHAAIALPDGRVLITGGYSEDTTYLFAELFDPRDESFKPMAGVHSMRANHAAHVLGDGRVLLLGGETMVAGALEPLPLAEVLRFDPARGVFEPLAPLAQPRTLATSVLLPGGALLLFGGQTAADLRSASAESYHPDRGGQAIAALDVPRWFHTATRLADGRVLIAGGEVGGLGYANRALVYE